MQHGVIKTSKVLIQHQQVTT